MAVYDEISLEFEKMYREDKSNDIFTTAHLHKTLKTDDFKDDINLERAAFVIQTKERLLDWHKFSQKLKFEISKYPNIRIVKNNKIINISYERNGKFIITSDKQSQISDYVINCSWQNIEFLNEKLGIGDSKSKKDNPDSCITYRLKLLAEVELPERLRSKHSMFFCVGPHAMFSNLGNGIGRITYAPVTNFATTTESKMPLQFERWLSKGLSKEESEEYGIRIIRGVSEYIPEMAKAKLIGVIAGIVKSKGSIDLKDKKSPFHKRDYSGVEEQQIGWIDNAAMKLFYCLGNAKEVAEILEKHQKAKLAIENIISDTIDNKEKRLRTGQKIIAKFLVNHLQRNFQAEELLDYRKSDLIKDDLITHIAMKEVIIPSWNNHITSSQRKLGSCAIFQDPSFRWDDGVEAWMTMEA